MTLKCCIIDDEPLAVELLTSYIEKTPYIKLEASFSSAIQAIDRIMQGDIDFVLCDIQMPNLNGLEFSHLVQGKTHIIFTTAFDCYAVESYKVSAVDYLLKPFSYQQFLQATQKVLRLIEMGRPKEIPNDLDEPQFIFVKSEYKLRQIFLNKILYIEGLKDYVKIYVEDEPHPILSLLSLKSLEEMLPPQRFMRVHRSFIVQSSKISVIDRNRIVFGKQYIPISDTYKSLVNHFIEEHLPK